ncbi:MAG: hypothetical protein P9M13_00175 [Candidatus Ancaeobacter aquaticus]|nr:hypothetical protein [Candidatus Ancaeobacter aquaticus]
MNIVHPAEEYRRIRSIMFSILHRDDVKNALSYLESQQKTIPYNSYIGLRAELFFYVDGIDKFKLTIAGDYGDSCDFAGLFGDQACRFDVTTNVNFKNLSKFAPFQKKGIPYYIVLMDYKNDKLIDIININFPFCSECGGRLLDILILTSESKMPDVSDMQKVVSVCSSDPYSHYYIRKESTDIFFNTFNAVSGAILDYEQFQISHIKQKFRNYEAYVDNELMCYAIDSAKYFKKEFQLNIVGCGGEDYFVTGRGGDGFWGTKMYWKDELVSKYIEDQYETLFQSY